jgi:hypothetical protein
MNMFDFIFGGTRKLELIRELLEQRIREMGFTDMESRLKIKEMGNFQLIGTPEGTIVTIVEMVLKMQRQGQLIRQILETIENQRRGLGHNVIEYSEILSLTRGSSEQASEAIPSYCFYRINLEYPGHMTEDQFASAFMQATQMLIRG